jgi:hypothetical protein
VFKDNAGLLKRHAREPLDELVNGSVVFEVLEERSHWYARASKHPGSAHAGGVALNGRARGPVDHASDGSTGVAV